MKEAKVGGRRGLRIRVITKLGLGIEELLLVLDAVIDGGWGGDAYRKICFFPKVLEGFLATA